MAVIYLFDAAKRPKRIIKAVQEIIHKEGEYSAVAQISGKEKPEYGDFFGFQCVDGRFRLFLITIMDRADETGIRTITGTDAALAELNGKILTGMSLSNTTAQNAAKNALNETGWQLGTVTGDGEVDTEDVYYESVWESLKTIAAAGKVRIVPYYEFADGEITGRKVDVLSKEPVFRGMIHTRKKGARNIYITKEGSPKGRVYGLGKIIGTGNPPEQMTFKEAVWSKANGDPADKPAGQDWVSIDGAISDDGYVFTESRETDPQKLLEKAYADLEKKQKPKASGTANITDMEWKPEYSHRVVRMWDLAVVRTEDGETAEATVINIERYYVKKHLTKITIGVENETDIPRLEEQIANLNNVSGITARRVGGVGNAAAQTKQLILNAEELIQLNSKRIELNAEEIELRATKVSVQELEDLTFVEFQEVKFEMDETAAKITATNQIVDNINNQVSGLSSELTVQADQIAARAYQYEVDELGNRVTTAESELILQSGEIFTKVSKDGVISSINQTAEEIKIQASKINLSGYVTMSEFEAEIANIDNLFAGNSTIGGLNVAGMLMTTNFDVASNATIFGYTTEWKSRTVQTSIPEFTTATITLQNGNSVKVVTGWATAPSSLRSTLNYLGQQ